MSLETQISELNATIKTLNETIKLLLQRGVISTPQAQTTPIEPEQAALLPDVAKTMNRTRDELQAMCLAATKRNAANRDIIKSIMLNNFEARKISDLADNQVDMCYVMIAEATQDD